LPRTREEYAKLKALLEELESFPHDYTLKVIGDNTPAFAQGAAELERRNSALRLHGRRESGKASHVALTYVFRARSADEIVELLMAAEAIPDVRVIL
jgi:putative lipoic acid-binding regulatory protein